MKKLLIKLLLGAAFAYGGYSLLEKSGNIVSQENYNEVENLCLHAIETKGVVSDSVQETTIKIKSAKVKMYELSYNFVVDGKNYKASKTVSDIEKELLPIHAVWYNKNNPSSNSVKNPCETLETYKNTKSVGKEFLYLIPGILLGLMGIGLIWGTIKSFIVSLFKKSAK